MIKATSSGGVVIFRGKILLLYKNYKNRYDGWVLPKGTVEDGEELSDTAVREVKEETDATASIIKYIGESSYSFNAPEDTIENLTHLLPSLLRLIILSHWLLLSDFCPRIVQGRQKVRFCLP